jgi:DNA glycosylase AlkZ-like
MRAAPGAAATSVRLLPSGDTYFLLWGADRELLVPDARRRSERWTPRVWPGAVIVDGEVAGTWRRAGVMVSIQSWRRLPSATLEAVEVEAQAFPLPGVEGEISVRWEA